MSLTDFATPDVVARIGAEPDPGSDIALMPPVEEDHYLANVKFFMPKTSEYARFVERAELFRPFFAKEEALVFAKTKVQEAVASVLKSEESYDRFVVLSKEAMASRIGMIELTQHIVQAETELIKAKTRVWDYLFILRAIEGPKSPRTLRIETMEAQYALLRAEMTTIQAGLATTNTLIKELQDSLLANRPEVEGTPSTRTHVSDTVQKSRSPPAPIFSGGKEHCKVHTWLEQFCEYCRIMCIGPEQMTSYATLCLKDKAAEHWANMKKALIHAGKDPYDFAVFRFAMVEHYVDLSVESTVRSRLSNLKQVHSVGEYHTKFRDILVEAVLHPLGGPEACNFFRNGLKKPIFEVIMRDASIRHEQASLEVVVRAAKEAEALLSMLAGRQSEDSARSPHRPKGKHPHKTSSGPPPKRFKPEEPPVGEIPKSILDQAMALHIPANVAKFRYRENMCVKCGRHGHNFHACRSPAIVPDKKPSATTSFKSAK